MCLSLVVVSVTIVSSKSSHVLGHLGLFSKDLIGLAGTASPCLHLQHK